MNSENKSLLLISVGPKTAPSQLPAARGSQACSRPESPREKGSCGLASKRQRASSEQQRSKGGCPIRRFTDQSLFAAPRDLSQRTTSFIASQRQGIHRIPLRHLIALIAKARPFLLRSAIEGKRANGLKRPVLLQTHPGIRAVRLQTRDWLLVGRRGKDDGRTDESVFRPSLLRVR